MNAAPMPWSARPATSHSCVGARPISALDAGEHDHADEEHAAAAEDVAEPAARDEQHGEAERVGVHGPLERGERRAEVVAGSTGSATFTTVLSSMIMNSAKHMAASVHHLRLSSLRRIRSGIAPLLRMQ